MRGGRTGLALVAVGFLLAGLAIEGLARRREASSGREEPLPRFGGLVPRSELGFRDYDYPPTASPGSFRAFVLGDSFTSAESVAFDDAYPKRLERALNHFASPTEPQLYEVLNLGRAGLSTPEEVALLEQMLDPADPDLIVVGYCLNDAEDVSDRTAIDRGGEGPPVSRAREEELPGGWLGALAERSAAVRLVSSRWSHGHSAHETIDHYLELYAEDSPGWQRTRAAFARLGAISRARGMPVVVMIFPLFSFGLDDGYPFAAIHDAVGAAAGQAGLVVLDLFPVYRGLDRVRLEAVPGDDPHPSEIGHRLAAERLWAFLIEQHLVPATVDADAPKAPNPLPAPEWASP